MRVDVLRQKGKLQSVLLVADFTGSRKKGVVKDVIFSCTFNF